MNVFEIPSQHEWDAVITAQFEQSRASSEVLRDIQDSPLGSSDEFRGATAPDVRDPPARYVADRLREQRRIIADDDGAWAACSFSLAWAESWRKHSHPTEPDFTGLVNSLRGALEDVGWRHLPRARFGVVRIRDLREVIAKLIGSVAGGNDSPQPERSDRTEQVSPALPPTPIEKPTQKRASGRQEQIDSAHSMIAFKAKVDGILGEFVHRSARRDADDIWDRLAEMGAPDPKVSPAQVIKTPTWKMKMRERPNFARPTIVNAHDAVVDRASADDDEREDWEDIHQDARRATVSDAFSVQALRQ